MTTPLHHNIITQLQYLRSSKRDQTFLDSFWRTGVWQYAHWDIIRWVPVPVIRSLSKSYLTLLKSEDIISLLYDQVHEVRLFALISLVYLYKFKKYWRDQTLIYQLYMDHIDQVNHRDLVDTSCRDIVWWYLLDHDRDVLYKLAGSNMLRRQRIAIVSTWMFLKHGQVDDTIRLSEILLNHPHDLIHKAVWRMLREMGKHIDQKVLIHFLNQHSHQMPRTMLRYAIEHLDPDQRAYYRNQ